MALTVKKHLLNVIQGCAESTVLSANRVESRGVGEPTLSEKKRKRENLEKWSQTERERVEGDQLM